MNYEKPAFLSDRKVRTCKNCKHFVLTEPLLDHFLSEVKNGVRVCADGDKNSKCGCANLEVEPIMR